MFYAKNAMCLLAISVTLAVHGSTVHSQGFDVELDPEGAAFQTAVGYDWSKFGSSTDLRGTAGTDGHIAFESDASVDLGSVYVNYISINSGVTTTSLLKNNTVLTSTTVPGGELHSAPSEDPAYYVDQVIDVTRSRLKEVSAVVTHTPQTQGGPGDPETYEGLVLVSAPISEAEFQVDAIN